MIATGWDELQNASLFLESTCTARKWPTLLSMLSSEEPTHSKRPPTNRAHDVFAIRTDGLHPLEPTTFSQT